MEINKENITTRCATNEDLPVLGKFLQMLVEAERPFNPTLKDGEIFYYDLETLIADEQTTVLVLELNAEVVGCGYAQIRSAKVYERHERFGYLGFMFVKPEFRGKGLNSLLLNELKQWVLSNGITEVRLDVYHDNDAAVRAYEKVGFKKLLTTMRCDINDMN
ncbi:GNAT family N-acetyltransferase [Pedobacter sp. MC2016-24]|uniref:GNAT family N-acetyltransferase n=1 Tax=Pedobacter sp. MC2016-24 TaxID=2780090 RepID=UPI001880179F|nr:GNAT family N-acetyltransferase [Pedobacter sp. MC2016-24]MBE9602289.1 GNAT family N-acetyltransferase [Pedobacter sp. MC2016-24]